MSWGVPEDAPPPRKRTSWGQPAVPPPAQSAAAAEEYPVDDVAWVPAPGDEIDFAAFHSGTMEELPTSPTPRPRTTPEQVVDLDADAGRGWVAPETVTASPSSGPTYVPPASSPVTESAAVTHESPHLQPDTAQAAAPHGTSPATEVGQRDPGTDLVPVRPARGRRINPAAAAESVEPSASAATTADEMMSLFDAPPSTGAVADLFDAFDPFGDQASPVSQAQPTAPPVPTVAVPAVVESAVPDLAPGSFGTQQQALDQWRAMRANSQAQALPQDMAAFVADQQFMERYDEAGRLLPVVDRLLGLAKGGSPALQGLINKFVLTRDSEVDAAQRQSYEETMLPLMAQNAIAVDPQDLPTVLDIAYDELIGIGPMGPLWRDDDVTEIMVSGPDKVTVERNGRLQTTPVRFRDLDHLKQTARDLSARVDDRAVSRRNPIVTAQLPKARVQFVVAPAAPIAGVSMTIRKFRPLFGLENLLEFGALTDEMASFLSDVVMSRANVLVSGGTGSGKTTMINALSAFIPDSERVVTIEDALELALTNTHVEQLVTKEVSSADDEVVIGQGELLRSALRMRPDRIIVGEIRDSEGCAVMLQAANTGHDGTMTTVHANDPDRAMRRLAHLFRGTSENMGHDLASEEVREAFDVVVQVIRRRNRRYISHISMVDKYSDKTIPIFTGRFDTGDERPTFTRVGGVGSDTDLGQRFFDAGLDPRIWGAN